jgi:VanZ family protein
LALVIAILSLTPQPEDILPVSLWDKLGHLLAYGALALALGHALARSGWAGAGLVVVGIVLPTVYGGLMEALQFLAPPRSPELSDFLGDFLGSCAGMALFGLPTILRLRSARQGRGGRLPVPDPRKPAAARGGKSSERRQE